MRQLVLAHVFPVILMWIVSGFCFEAKAEDPNFRDPKAESGGIDMIAGKLKADGTVYDDPCLDPDKATKKEYQKRCAGQNKANKEAKQNAARIDQKRRETTAQEAKDKGKEEKGICDGVALKNQKPEPLEYPHPPGTKGEQALDGWSNPIEVSVITDEEEQHLMWKLRDLESKRGMAVKEMQQEICQVRAQFTSCFVEAPCQLKAAKVFVEPTGIWNDTFGVHSYKVPGKYYNWGYHVATLVKKKVGNESVLHVIDIFQDQVKMIPYDEWIQELQKGPDGKPQKIKATFEANNTYTMHSVRENRVGKKCSTALAEQALGRIFKENAYRAKLRQIDEAVKPNMQ